MVLDYWFDVEHRFSINTFELLCTHKWEHSSDCVRALNTGSHQVYIRPSFFLYASWGRLISFIFHEVDPCFFCPQSGSLPLSFLGMDPYPLCSKRWWSLTFLEVDHYLIFLDPLDFSYPQGTDSLLEVPLPSGSEFPPREGCGRLILLMTFPPTFSCWVEEVTPYASRWVSISHSSLGTLDPLCFPISPSS